MDSYQGVPLGVESAWPAFPNQKAKRRMETDDNWLYAIGLALVVAVVALIGLPL